MSAVAAHRNAAFGPVAGEPRKIVVIVRYVLCALLNSLYRKWEERRTCKNYRDTSCRRLRLQRLTMRKHENFISVLKNTCCSVYLF